ncbi:chromate efflux transporter [Roseovarius aestuarii]|nr:chromate efflux transporter [Roseovarius aestuarii]
MHNNWTDFLRSFARIGLLSFGGPAAQISLMHSELVDRRRWLNEQQFLGALSFCMLLPGPEAMQLATYTGWKLRGTIGGLIAGLLFVLPGAVVILALALAYARFGQLPLVQSSFLGIKAAVMVIVVQALWRLSQKALKGAAHWALAVMGFVAIFALGLPFPAVIAVAAVYGAVTIRDPAPMAPAVSPPGQTGRTIRTIAIWSALWSAPILVVWAAGADFLLQVALFFSKLAIVTFGGAYAVLAYMTQTVTQTHGWLSTAQMIDALGLAETTPGPLILVTQFVAHLAGYQAGGLSLALLAGAITLWVTFVPCFLWIFTGAPYLERLLAQPRLKGGLSAISATVVGVIANLSIWFALHVLFSRVTPARFGPLPDWSSFDTTAAGLTVLAVVLMLIFRLGLLVSLGLMAIAGAVVQTIL